MQYYREQLACFSTVLDNLQLSVMLQASRRGDQEKKNTKY